ncbi:DUF2800 domain-containing protein [Caloranaerobacter ferrireducens]|uniref:DUF2800 domain-containing protein n=1 Tax=Caloranaerobacter ferrireducens TaxID=1323370 RepID=UPI00084D898A|nr:DUF2800 domain-containing protein [Caloranaerobacter ferrireducens]
MGEHALLSASGAYRWLKCPPSVRLEELVEEESNEYAKEGSFAHTLAELKLSYYLGNLNEAQYNRQLKAMKKDNYYTAEMEQFIETYTTLAIEKINEAKVRTKDPIIMIEMRLDYSPWVPEGFGTGDLVLVTDEILEIVDLKYGKGIKVSAIGNPQMRLYALGALNQYSCLYDIQKVKATICQPRLDNISTEEIEVNDLLKWAEEVVKPKAKLAWNGEGEFAAGEHCVFCKVKATCRARANENLKLACMDFREPPLLTDEEIVEVLKQIRELQKWALDVDSYALAAAINDGKKWPGMKLVEGKRSRKYTSEEDVAQKLLDAGYSEDMIYSKSLLSLTKLEKKIGKKEFEKIIGDLIEISSGKLKLVPEDDKRPEVKSTAEIDFK